MKNKFSLIIIALFAGVLFFQSCEKDDKTVSKKDLLVSHVWGYDSLEVSDMDDEGLVFSAALLHLVYQNGVLEFNNDGTYNLNSDLTNIDGVWELASNNIVIFDKATDDEMEWTIVKINSSEAHFKMHLEGEMFSTPYEGDVTLQFKAK